MKKIPELTFVAGSEVKFAQQLDEKLKSDPKAQEISAQASAAMAEIEDIYWGSGNYNPATGVYRTNRTHSNELIAWIKDAGIEPEVLREKILAMARGETIIIRDQTFVKTGDGKFMEAQAYINLLEKSLARSYSQIIQPPPLDLQVNTTIVQNTEELNKIKSTWLYRICKFLDLVP